MKRLPSASVAWIMALVALAVHALGEPHYGFFRDELYFIICGRHPAWGYVDQPPIVPLLAAFSQLFGPSLVALRFVSSIFAAATVYVACSFSKELGGGTFAQVLAGLVVMLATASVALSTDSPTMWLWPLGALLVLRIVGGASPKLWIGVGAVFGLCAEVKYSIVFFAVALVLGLLMTPERRALKSTWFFGGVALAALIAAPNFAWQAVHGFPMLELLRNGAAGKNVVLSPIEFMIRQVAINNVVLSALWIVGLLQTFQTKRLRWLGLTYVILIAMMIALHAKDYYPAAVYTCLFSAGAVWVEARTRPRRVLRAAIVTVAVLAGLVGLPLAMPVLPESAYASYAHSLHLGVAPEENKKAGVLPQEYADMHGWPELAATVAGVYARLPSADRARAAVFTDNYGEAAAIDFFGPRYDLPPALSSHNQYFVWGPRGYDGSVIIRVGGDPSAMKRRCQSVQQVTTFENPLGMPYESDLAISVCRGLHPSLQQVWPFIKHYD